MGNIILFKFGEELTHLIDMTNFCEYCELGQQSVASPWHKCAVNLSPHICKHWLKASFSRWRFCKMKQITRKPSNFITGVPLTFSQKSRNISIIIHSSFDPWFRNTHDKYYWIEYSTRNKSADDCNPQSLVHGPTQHKLLNWFATPCREPNYFAKIYISFSPSLLCNRMGQKCWRQLIEFSTSWLHIFPIS